MSGARSRYLTQLAFVVLLGVVLFGVLSCDRHREPIKIGYVGGLTSRVAGLGVAGRDGALFAVETINQDGGVHGRQVVLKVRDDKQDPQVARTVVRELINENVAAIIGHMTSSMSVATLDLINASETIMISPTSKSNLLSGKDDYFFRVTPASSNNSRRVADLAVSRFNLKTFAVVYDLNNAAFTESWLEYFSRFLEENGGEVGMIIPFSSGSDFSFYEIAEELKTGEPDALLMLSSAIDAALLAQQLKKVELPLPIFTAEWSFTSDLISYGGSAVEGLTSYHSFNADSDRPQYVEHRQRFVRRFGYEPSFASVLAYDATRLLLLALRRNPDVPKLKQTLLDYGIYNGLQSDFSFDAFGDVDRQLFLTTVENGRFKVIVEQ